MSVWQPLVNELVFVLAGAQQVLKGVAHGIGRVGSLQLGLDDYQFTELVEFHITMAARSLFDDERESFSRCDANERAESSWLNRNEL